MYHERWQHEIAYLALRHTLLEGRVLRSKDPAGVEQEMWALLALYQVLRTAITDRRRQPCPGTDPDRASYQIAVHTARTLVTSARGVATGAGDLAGDIGRAVLASLHGPRRPRVCARRVKSPLSRWNKHPPGKPRSLPADHQHRPPPITPGTDQSATHHEQYVTTARPLELAEK